MSAAEDLRAWLSTSGAARKAEQAARPRYVYTLRDGDDRVVYVGQTVNVAERILQHHASIYAPATYSMKPATWLLDVRGVSVVGPFGREECLAVERDTIERLQPRANVQYTARDHRPAIAARSAERAEVTS